MLSTGGAWVETRDRGRGAGHAAGLHTVRRVLFQRPPTPVTVLAAAPPARGIFTSAVSS
jgi:hypothetical protein